MKKYPYNTLFMLMSLDGKISTGAGEKTDFDKDLPKIAGAKDGLFQYYDYEQTTDLHSMNSGKVLAKIGINKRMAIKKTPVSFIVIDNRNLTAVGVKNLSMKSKTLYLVTTNKKHPAFSAKADNIEILFYDKKIDFGDLFARLCGDFGIERITIQTGGTLNAQLLRGGYIDEVSIFVAPVLVGGGATPTLADGDSIESSAELSKIIPLKLISAETLMHSYVHLRYRTIRGATR